MYQQTDGYLNNKDWLNKHKEVMPSSFLFTLNYEDITEHEVSNRDPEYYNYTPRTSFITELNEKGVQPSVKEILNKVSLSERERLVIQYIYEQNLTQEEVGSLLNLSQPSICLIRKSALLKLKRKLN